MNNHDDVNFFNKIEDKIFKDIHYLSSYVNYDNRPEFACNLNYIFIDGKCDELGYEDCNAIIGLAIDNDDPSSAAVAKIVYDPDFDNPSFVQAYPNHEAFVHFEWIGPDHKDIANAVKSMCDYNDISISDLELYQEFCKEFNLEHNKVLESPEQEQDNYWFVATQNQNGTWNVKEYNGSKEDFQICVNEHYNAELEGKAIISEHEFTEGSHTLINDISKDKPDLKQYETFVAVNNYLSTICPNKDMTNEVRYITQTYGDKFLQADKDERVNILKEIAKELGSDKKRETSQSDSKNNQKSKDADLER